MLVESGGRRDVQRYSSSILLSDLRAERIPVGDQRRVEIGGIIKCNLSVSQKTIREFAGQFCSSEIRTH
jgi:hypothetical protein